MWVIGVATFVLWFQSSASYDDKERSTVSTTQKFPMSAMETFTRDMMGVKYIIENQEWKFLKVQNVRSISNLLTGKECAMSFDAEIKVGNMLSGPYSFVGFKAANTSIETYTERAHQMIQLMHSLRIPRLWSFNPETESMAFKAVMERIKVYVRRVLSTCNARGDNVQLEMFAFKREASKANFDRSVHSALLHIGNCLVPEIAYLQLNTQNYYVPFTCMLTEKETRILLTEQQWALVQNLKQYVHSNMCRLQTKFWTYIQTADDLVSVVQNVGNQMVRALSMGKYAEDFPEKLWVFEEIDGRIAELVRQHFYKCTKDPFMSSVHTPIRNTMQHGQIKDLYMFDRHTSKHFFMATYDNGQKALGKVPHACENTNELGEGMKEILSYYIDRAFVLNRFPHTVIKRLYFSSLKTGPITITPEGNKKKFPWNFQQKELDYYSEYFEYDKSKKSPYIDIVFIGYMKELSRFDGRMYDDMEHSLILRHNMDDMTSVSRQALRDTTDIVILDFISHNFDRKGDNVVRSELRVAAFDAGHGFKLVAGDDEDRFRTGKLICERQLERPPLLKKSVIVRAEIPSSCTSLPISRRSCQFSKFTVDQIRGADKKEIARKVKSIHDREFSPYSTCEAVKKYKLYEGIEVRIQYFLDYLDDCYERFGDAVYI